MRTTFAFGETPVEPTTMGVRAILLLLLALCAAAGCSSKHEASGSTLTERQRDSLLSRSSLPGASTVGRALKVQERAAAHAAGMDSVAH
jgi:hypothetical protein